MLKVLHIKLSATYFTRDNLQQLKGGVSKDHSNQSSECLLMSPLIMTTLSSQVSPNLLQHSLQSDGAGELHTALCPQEGHPLRPAGQEEEARGPRQVPGDFQRLPQKVRGRWGGSGGWW